MLSLQLRGNANMADIKAKDAAKRLGIDKYAISRYCRNGLFPGAYKKNPYSQRRSDWYIPEEAIIAFENKRREQASNDRTN